MHYGWDGFGYLKHFRVSEFGLVFGFRFMISNVQNPDIRLDIILPMNIRIETRLIKIIYIYIYLKIINSIIIYKLTIYINFIYDMCI